MKQDDFKKCKERKSNGLYKPGCCGGSVVGFDSAGGGVDGQEHLL